MEVSTIPKYRISAESVGYLEDEIEAANEEEARNKMEELLDNGAMKEVDGSIENKQVEEIK